MKLFIDTSEKDTVTIGLDDKRYSKDARDKKSQTLLPFILETLEAQNASLADVTEIEVAPGPGSYTGLRVGATIANTMGYILSVPVNGKNVTVDPVLPVYEA